MGVPMTTNGLRLPQGVRMRSEMKPMSGSVIYADNGFHTTA